MDEISNEKFDEVESSMDLDGPIGYSVYDDRPGVYVVLPDPNHGSYILFSLLGADESVLAEMTQFQTETITTWIHQAQLRINEARRPRIQYGSGPRRRNTFEE